MAKKKTMTKKQLEANRKNAKKGGRKKGSVSEETKMKQEIRKKLTQKVDKEFDGLMDSMVDLAKGVLVESVGLDGVARVYKKAPNVEILKYLTDQVIGKADNNIKVDDLRRFTIDEIEDPDFDYGSE